jgi:hypothetical protein
MAYVRRQISTFPLNVSPFLDSIISVSREILTIGATQWDSIMMNCLLTVCLTLSSVNEYHLVFPVLVALFISTL